jgi:hypothetical protein
MTTGRRRPSSKTGLRYQSSGSEGYDCSYAESGRAPRPINTKCQLCLGSIGCSANQVSGSLLAAWPWRQPKPIASADPPRGPAQAPSGYRGGHLTFLCPPRSPVDQFANPTPNTFGLSRGDLSACLPVGGGHRIKPQPTGAPATHPNPFGFPRGDISHYLAVPAPASESGPLISGPARQALTGQGIPWSVLI